MENVWKAYHAMLEKLRQDLLALDFARSAAEQAKVANLMQQAQAITYAMFIAPNQCYGRYIDRYERRNGEWRIARRQVFTEFVSPELGLDIADFVQGS